MNIPYPKPLQYGYTVYIKSGCPYCERLKYLLSNINPQPKYIDCDAFLTFNRDKFMFFIKQLCGKDYRTFPMVFLNGYFIGGFTETKAFCDEAINLKN